MANHKTTDQPGSNNKQPNTGRTRNVDARDTSGQQPNLERTRSNQNKSKQVNPEPDTHAKTKSELEHERGPVGRGN